MPRRKKPTFHDAYYRSSIIYTCTPLIAGLIVSAGMGVCHAFFGPDSSESPYHFKPLDTQNEAVLIEDQVIHEEKGCGFVWEGCEHVCFEQLDLKKCVECGQSMGNFRQVDGTQCP